MEKPKTYESLNRMQATWFSASFQIYCSYLHTRTVCTFSTAIRLFAVGDMAIFR